MITHKSNFGWSWPPNPCFQVFSYSEPIVEKATKEISNAMGQEGDIMGQKVKKLELSFYWEIWNGSLY